MKCLTQNKFLSDKELDQLRMNLKNESNKVHVLMVELALFTGARSAEILEVKTEDFNGKTVVIYGKKNSNNRTIPLSPAFAEKLSKYVKGLEEGSLLFPVSTRQFRKVWKKFHRSSRQPKSQPVQNADFCRNLRKITRFPWGCTNGSIRVERKRYGCHSCWAV